MSTKAPLLVYDNYASEVYVGESTTRIRINFMGNVLEAAGVAFLVL